MPSLNTTVDHSRLANSMLLVLQNTTLMGLALPPQLAAAAWQEIERIFVLPEAKHLPYEIIDTYVSLMIQAPQRQDQTRYQERLKTLAASLKVQPGLPLETAREISCPEFGV